MKFKLVIRESRLNANGMTPILLRISNKRVDRYINTEILTHVEGWNKDIEKIEYSEIYSKKEIDKVNKEIHSFKNRYLSHFESQVSVIDQKAISVDEFLEIVNPKHKNQEKVKSTNFFELIDNKITMLKETNKLGTAKYYHDTRNSVLRFQNSEKLSLDSINYEWIKKYEAHLKHRGCKDSGVAVRMRAIRAIFNEAIASDIIEQDKYPFGKKFKIDKLKSSYNPRPISIQDIEVVKQFDTSIYPKLKLTKDLFLFSYYFGGINFIDMIRLERSVISKDFRIKYTRKKTSKSYDLKMTDGAIEIAKYYIENKINTKYLFPVLLKDDLTEAQFFNRKHKTITQFNRNLKELGRICKIDIDLATYVARHSLASNLYELGASSDAIKEVYGHGNVETTNHYIKKLGHKITDSALDLIN